MTAEIEGLKPAPSAKRRRWRVALGVVALALLVGGFWPGRILGSTVHIMRTSCYGMCPFYAVDVFRLPALGVGVVAYRGLEDVGSHWLRIGVLSEHEMTTLVQYFADAGYCGLDSNYDGMVSDVPSCHTAFAGTCRHRIRSRWDAPARLTWLECKIDELVDSDRWIQPERYLLPGETYKRFDCDRLIRAHPALPRL